MNPSSALLPDRAAVGRRFAASARAQAVAAAQEHLANPRVQPEEQPGSCSR